MKATIKTHFEESDYKCDGDYVDVEILVDDVVVQTYGDYYHDKGRDRAEAFLEGYAKGAKMPFESIQKIKIPDREI